MLTCGLIILDMNADNGLAISLSIYLSLSKNDMLRKNKQTNNNKTKQRAKRPRKKEEKTFPPRVVEPQTYDVKGQREIHYATVTLNVKQKLYT